MLDQENWNTVGLDWVGWGLDYLSLEGRAI